MRTRDVNKERVIREKGIEMIVKEGFDGFSMQKLARAATFPLLPFIYILKTGRILLSSFVLKREKKCLMLH
jgi:hypothetical protein